MRLTLLAGMLLLSHRAHMVSSISWPDSRNLSNGVSSVRQWHRRHLNRPRKPLHKDTNFFLKPTRLCGRRIRSHGWNCSHHMSRRWAINWILNGVTNTRLEKIRFVLRWPVSKAARYTDDRTHLCKCRSSGHWLLMQSSERVRSAWLRMWCFHSATCIKHAAALWRQSEAWGHAHVFISSIQFSL